MAAALTLAALAVVTSTAAAREHVIAHETEPTAVDAYGGRVVWSSYSSKRKSYALKVSYRGRVKRLPLRPRRAPFDVDLGPDAGGRTVAVYSRCRKEDTGGSPEFGGFGEPQFARGCDLYEYSFATGDERRLRLPGTRSTSEYSPAIWGDTIAFARIFERRKGLAGSVPWLYYARLPSGRARRTPGGTRGDYHAFLSDDFWDGGNGPTGLDLHGDRIGFSWEAELDNCPGYGEDFPVEQPEIWVGRLGKPAKRLAYDCWGETEPQGRIILFGSPSFDRGRFYYYERRFADSDWSDLRSYNLRTGHRHRGRAPLEVFSLARSGGVTYYARYRDAPDDVDSTVVARSSPSAR